MSVTDAQMAIYRASAQNRQQRYQNRLRHRQQLGLKVAHQASDLLKRDFNAQRVVLFGSMRSPNQVHERSDVDLAVWGLNPRDYFRAVGQLQGLHPEIAVDLVEVETAPSRLGEAIAATGIDL